MARLIALGVLALALVGALFAISKHNQQPVSVSAPKSAEALTPAIGKKIAPAPSPIGAAVAVASAPWDNLLPRLRALDENDQATLNTLYGDAKTLITADEPGNLKRFRASMPELVKVDFKESFFEVSAGIRFSKNPEAIISALLSYTPPADPVGKDLHHLELTPAVRYLRLEAFVIRELRQRYLRGELALEQSARVKLVAELTSRALTEQSLNVGLEIFQLLAALGERKAIDAALVGHSPRDQKLILGVIGRHR